MSTLPTRPHRVDRWQGELADTRSRFAPEIIEIAKTLRRIRGVVDG